MAFEVHLRIIPLHHWDRMSPGGLPNSPILTVMRVNLAMQNKRLLIIDDDEAMLTLLAEFFDSQGFEVLEFRSARAAVEALKDRVHPMVQAVISDINMPMMSGIEFIDWLNGKVPAPVPVILISAFGSAELEKQALDAGARFFMKKPFALSALKRAVDTVVKAS